MGKPIRQDLARGRAAKMSLLDKGFGRSAESAAGLS